ncbi:MAG TPA: sigma-70 family RNA polymerase sigma factor [Bryobacteraceae bacterium]|nr:sigma-70 family RNA polymerase sigma factor [Bryobacteraceae bacterium]
MPSAAESAEDLTDFEAVVRLHWPRVLRFAMASLRDRDAAESLAQDCFWKAYRARATFRGDASVGTWLMQIAVNLVRDYARNRRLQFWRRTCDFAVDFGAASRVVPDEGCSPERSVAAKERVAAVWAATRGLSERQRTVFLLRFVEDMDLLEIAAVTGLKEGTVKAHLFRALQAVRAQIGELK